MSRNVLNIASRPEEVAIPSVTSPCFFKTGLLSSLQCEIISFYIVFTMQSARKNLQLENYPKRQGECFKIQRFRHTAQAHIITASDYDFLRVTVLQNENKVALSDATAAICA